MTTVHPSVDKSEELQTNLDRISQRLGAPSMPVGLRTNDGLNIYVDDDGLYHFAYFERGKLGFDRVGDLDDVLYWYCEGIVSTQASRHIGDRKQSFLYQYEVLSKFSLEWAKRQVSELAEMFRNGQPDDISFLPDIGEPL
ncbi:hypothetical protein BCA37_20890 [Mycobacterium sp. djl-10]|nr:hypothetical protein BCA37_20890 [Mycobacterium sp. djl-10]